MHKETATLAINVFNIGFCIPGLIGFRDWFFLIPIMTSCLVLWAFAEYG